MIGSSDNAVIANIIMAESLEDANILVKNSNIGNFCIEYNPDPDFNPPAIGYTWNGESFSSPVIAEESENANI